MTDLQFKLIVKILGMIVSKLGVCLQDTAAAEHYMTDYWDLESDVEELEKQAGLRERLPDESE